MDTIEGSVTLITQPKFTQWTLNCARIEAHYYINGGFMTEGQLLAKENIDKIRHIPAIICNGRYDVLCPSKTAFELYKQWPEAELNIIPDSGHSARDPGLLSSE
jgi:proline iminopeptidase